MQVFKAVKQSFDPDQMLLGQMGSFRDMVNDCLRIGLGAGVWKFVELKHLCFPRMLEYDLHQSYRISAIYEAGRVLAKYKTDSETGTPGRPYCRKLFLTASLGVHVEQGELHLPDDRRVNLNRHMVSILSQPGISANSVTITPRNLGICYMRDVKVIEPLGAVGLDFNLENVTTADSEGRSDVYDLTPSIRVHAAYKRVTSRFRRHDYRVRGTLLRKYGTLERNAREALLHNVSSLIVREALRKRYAIVMEDLRGLKGTFVRNDGNTAEYLSTMNSWPFGRLRMMVFYKAMWDGVPVLWVDPSGTSNECSHCGGGMTESPERHPMIKCKVCGLEINRDLNSPRIILKRGMKRLGMRSVQWGAGS